MKNITLVIFCAILTINAFSQGKATYNAFSFEEMLQAVQIADNAHKEAERKLNNDFLSGNDAWHSKNYPRALQLFLSCDALNNRFDGNLIEQNILELNIAHCYYKMDNYANAKDWYYKAMTNGHPSAREWYEHTRDLVATSNTNTNRTNTGNSNSTQIKQGKVSASEFFTLTDSSLSQFSSIMRERGFSLAYTRDKKTDRDDYTEIAWGYCALYDESSDSFSFMRSLNPSIVKMIYDGETPLLIVYSFDQMSIFNDFQNNIHEWGYYKADESVNLKTQEIVVEFENGTSYISLTEGSSTSSWKYTIVWGSLQ